MWTLVDVGTTSSPNPTGTPEGWPDGVPVHRDNNVVVWLATSFRTTFLTFLSSLQLRDSRPVYVCCADAVFLDCSVACEGMPSVTKGACTINHSYCRTQLRTRGVNQGNSGKSFVTFVDGDWKTDGPFVARVCELYYWVPLPVTAVIGMLRCCARFSLLLPRARRVS